VAVTIREGREKGEREGRERERTRIGNDRENVEPPLFDPCPLAPTANELPLPFVRAPSWCIC